MAEFRHHPDGRIYIDGSVISIDDFLIEEPDYSLPAGAIGRIYDSVTKRHIITNGKDQKDGGPFPEGDGYIANVITYLANIEARKPTPPEPTREIKIRSDSDYPSHAEFFEAYIADRGGDPSKMQALKNRLDALLIKYPANP